MALMRPVYSSHCRTGLLSTGATLTSGGGISGADAAWLLAGWVAFHYGAEVAAWLSDDGPPGSADLLGGYAVYLLPTLVIKGLVAAIAVLALRARHEWLRVLGLILAEAAMVAGYFVVEWLLLGYGFAAASASVLGNAMQGLSGVVVGLLLIPLLKRVKL